jgi:hypothetical protein
VNALSPDAGGGTPAAGEGFVPAAGGLEEDDGEGRGACRGAVRLPDTEACVVVPRRENFWTTREEGLP